MPVLGNSRHEHFAQAIAKGTSPSKAYVLAGYSEGGALAKPVYKVDTGLVSLIAQLLAHEKQAAEELGQWTEKREYSSRVGIDVVKAQLRVTQHRMAEEKR